MTVYQNTVESADINLALGSPILTTNDEVHVVVGSANYNTGLGGINGAKLDRVLIGGGYSGDVGNGNDGLEINADLLSIETAGRRVAIEGTGGQTIDKVEWRPNASAEGYFANGDIDDLDVLAAGPLTLADDMTVDNVVAAGRGVDVSILGNPAAMTLLRVNGSGGKAKVSNQRDFAAAIIGPGGTLLNDSTDVTPSGNIDISGGTLDHRGGNIGGTITTDGYCVVDFSKLVASITINAWDVNGELEIIEPPAGITVTLPTAAQIKGKVYYA